MRLRIGTWASGGFESYQNFTPHPSSQTPRTFPIGSTGPFQSIRRNQFAIPTDQESISATQQIRNQFAIQAGRNQSVAIQTAFGTPDWSFFCLTFHIKKFNPKCVGVERNGKKTENLPIFFFHLTVRIL